MNNAEFCNQSIDRSINAADTDRLTDQSVLCCPCCQSFHTYCFAAAVAADWSTAVVAAVAVKRINPECCCMLLIRIIGFVAAAAAAAAAALVHEA